VSQSAFFLWGGLIAVIVLLLAVLALLIAKEHREPPGSKVGPADCLALLAEARELDEVASAAFAKALAAADLAARCAADRDAAQANLELASATQDETALALEAAARSLAAAPVRVSSTSGGGESREASHAAMAAYRRGAISVEQLHALWQQIDGWDKRHEDEAHTMTRLRAQDTEARRRYDAAALAERTARQADEVAQVASRALTQEAADAAREAQLAHLLAQDCLRRVPGRPRAGTG
jgi:hypothetical protein